MQKGIFNYNEDPEVLKEALRIFRVKTRVNQQFDGSFQYGKIDGLFYSNTIFDVRKMISLIRVNGKYKLNQGTMSLRFSPSYSFKLISFIWLTIAVLGLTALIYSQEIHFWGTTSLIIGSSFTLFYQIMYHFLRKEFIRLMDDSLNLAKEKMLINLASKAQNTAPKPPHSIPSE